LSDWVKVIAVAEFPCGEYRVVEVDGAMVAVFNLDGEYYAIEDVCTHDGAELTGGPMKGCEIICPRHGARSNIQTGDALSPPAYEPTAVLPVKVEDGIVYTRDDRWD